MRDVPPHEALDDFVKPYTIVTTADGNNVDAMTAVWVSQVSFDPPMVMVSVGQDRKTHDFIERSGEFVLNTLKEDQKKIADFFGHTSLNRDKDKIDEADVPMERGQKVKAPIIKNSPSSMECRVVGKQECGDHTVYIGEVVAAHKEESAGKAVGLYKNRIVIPP